MRPDFHTPGGRRSAPGPEAGLPPTSEGNSFNTGQLTSESQNLLTSIALAIAAPLLSQSS
jgi:hypothetical protein